MDTIDLNLLRQLQSDSRRSMQELGERVNLSASACHRRIRLLEERGLIASYHAVLDAEALGFGMTFLAEVVLTNQDETTLAEFENAVRTAPEVLECTLMAGQWDYVLRLACRDAADFERIHRRLLTRLPHVARLHSNMVIRTVKPLSGYPI